MSRITPYDAMQISRRNGFRLTSCDFHSLTTDEVQGVINAADAYGYRAPKHRNGSRARYFHAFLCRVAARSE